MYYLPLLIIRCGQVHLILLIIGVSVCTFVAINLIDVCVGIVVGVVKRINRNIKDRRLLKGFCETGTIEEIE